MILVIVLISLFSCSKDTDLLADYVVSDLQEARFIGNLAISDNFVVTPQKSIVLDVLANDTFINPEKVKIVETSQPTNGTVVINEDKTLTYYPDSSDAPDTNTGNETEDSQAEPENNPAQEDTSTPAQTDTKEGTSEEETTVETPKEKQTPQKEDTGQQEQTQQPPQQKQPEPKPKEKEKEEQYPQEEESSQKEEQDETVTEDFTYTAETTDEEGNKKTQDATVTVTTQMGPLRAFPGAEGFGRDTRGGRNGIVYHVTNLSNSGPGSLRYGLQKIKVPRTIVFDVSGYINWQGDCSIRDPYVTIAGETAPKGGITIRGGALIIRTSEVIIKHLAIRPGVGAGDDSDCVRIVAASSNLHIQNVIMDHLSLSWSRDENIGMAAGVTNSVRNVTVQNCLIAEPLENYGILVGKRASNISILRNLWANVPNRIPETTYGHLGESFEFINNIIYNYSRPTTIVFGTDADVIGNAYKLASSNPAQTNLRYQSGPYSLDASKGKIYAFDNIQIGRSNPLGFKSAKWKTWERTTKVLTSSVFKPLPSSSLESKLLTDVGSIHFKDPVDSRILSEYRLGIGIMGPVNETVVGGYPPITSVSRPANYDNDKDGIADNWEIANGLDPTNPNDGKEDANGDGFTNLERFFYSLTQS